MDYALVHRVIDGIGKILDTTPGTPDTGSYVTEADMLAYVASHTLTQGYYYNGVFYVESAHTTPIATNTDYLYLDLHSDTLFRWNGASYVRLIPADILTRSMVVDNVTTQTTDLPLSANMGYELQDQIDNLKARGRFLSLWDCITGLPATNPVEMPYSYQTGDYYIVSYSVFSLLEDTPVYDPTADYAVGDFTVYNDALYQCNTAIVGGEAWNASHWDAITDNYVPNGATYTGAASTTTSLEEIKTNDFYWYDGTNWLLLSNTAKTLTFANIAGDPNDNLALAAEFSDVVRHDYDIPGSAVLVNSDLLDGHPASYFATEAEVDDMRGNSDEYDPTDSYDKGDYVVQNGILYRCLYDSTTGTWDATKWIRIDLTTLESYSQNAVFKTADLPGTATPINADELNGHPDTYFASKDDLTAWTFLETVTGTNTSTLPSGWKALRLIANYTDDTIPFEITRDEYDKCTNGTQIALSGGSMVRSTAVRVTTTTAGIAWFRTASISGGSLTGITNVESSSKLHVYYR